MGRTSRHRARNSEYRRMKLRSCGSCTECCTTLAIPSLQKPKCTECPHLKLPKKRKRGGCGIYNKRPSECSSFQCEWTAGSLNRAHRPDKTGIMAYWVDSQFGEALLITETRHGAFENNPRVLELTLDLAHRRGKAALLATWEGQGTAMLPESMAPPDSMLKTGFTE